MIQITPISDKQKRKIYKKMKRKDLINMLIENQRIIENIKPTAYAIQEN